MPCAAGALPRPGTCAWSGTQRARWRRRGGGDRPELHHRDDLQLPNGRQGVEV